MIIAQRESTFGVGSEASCRRDTSYWGRFVLCYLVAYGGATTLVVVVSMYFDRLANSTGGLVLLCLTYPAAILLGVVGALIKPVKRTSLVRRMSEEELREYVSRKPLEESDLGQPMPDPSDLVAPEEHLQRELATMSCR